MDTVDFKEEILKIEKLREKFGSNPNFQVKITENVLTMFFFIPINSFTDFFFKKNYLNPLQIIFSTRSFFSLIIPKISTSPFPKSCREKFMYSFLSQFSTTPLKNIQKEFCVNATVASAMISHFFSP